LLRGNSSVPARAPDVEAYNLFLQGRYFAQRQSPEDSKRAIPYLQRSLDLDPSYAPAWVELANVNMTQADYGWIPSAEAYSRAREAVHQALVLDPNLASAHSALGWIQSGIDRDWTAAEKSMRKALALEPGNPEVLTRTGLAVAGMGRLEEGLGLLEKALERDPLRLDSLDYRAYVLTSMGRFDEAVAVSRKVFELDPSRGNAGFGIGLPLLLKGELDAALQQMEGETTESWRLFGLSLVYHSLGRRADSDAELARLKQKYAGEMAFRIAETHAWRGENDLAFEWLDRAYDQQEAVLADIKLSQLVRRLSNDPRYTIFLKKMNLPA